MAQAFAFNIICLLAKRDSLMEIQAVFKSEEKERFMNIQYFLLVISAFLKLVC